MAVVEAVVEEELAEVGERREEEGVEGCVLGAGRVWGEVGDVAEVEFYDVCRLGTGGVVWG